jgi:membrane-bound inhibitor of C-type lysozyme
MRSFAILSVLVLLAAAGAAAATPSPAPQATPARIKTTYICSGLKVVAYYDKNRVAFVYGAKHYSLPHVISADGARFMGSGLEWWEKGPNVTLSSVAPGETTGDTVLANCVAVKK